MHHHVSKLAIFLVIATLCFVACAFGLTTPYHKLAVYAGMGLVFLMTCGFFYATLHLQKVQ